MYIEMEISEMEMSQRIHFWHQILLKMLIFLRKWQKKPHFFGQKFLWQANKNNFELKMPKSAKNVFFLTKIKIRDGKMAATTDSPFKWPWVEHI